MPLSLYLPVTSAADVDDMFVLARPLWTVGAPEGVKVAQEEKHDESGQNRYGGDEEMVLAERREELLRGRKSRDGVEDKAQSVRNRFTKPRKDGQTQKGFKNANPAGHIRRDGKAVKMFEDYDRRRRFHHFVEAPEQ